MTAPTPEGWLAFARTVDGHALADRLGVDLGALSGRLWSGYLHGDGWEGSLVELRPALFHEAEEARVMGDMANEHEYLMGISSLLNAIAVRDDERRKTAKEPPLGAPQALRSWIGGHFGPTFEVEWLEGRLVYQAFNAWREFGLPEQAGAVTRFVRPTRRRWKRFWDVLDRIDAWGWDPEFARQVMDGTAWEMAFEAQGRRVSSRGSNAYPGTESSEPSRAFRRACRAVSRLVAGLSFC